MLHVHRAERADGLVGALCDLLAAPPGDPFAPDVVAVPTRGMERWLAQRLSTALGASPGRADGVCGNVLFPSPGALVAEAVGAGGRHEDPWAPERALWPLLEVLDASLHTRWAAPLHRHLQADPARRFTVARRTAERFDRYALQRPSLLEGWRAGADAGDWQAELWRRLRERLAGPDPAERLHAACAGLRARPQDAGLPGRLSLFGLTRLPPGHLDVLRALAEARDVHLFLLHPSPALWARVAALAPPPGRVARREDPTRDLPANPLLRSWGRDARELQLVLGAGHADHHHPVAAPGTTLLARVQAAVRDDVPPQVAPLHPQDRSLAVHACHGRARQVEVLRDAVLHLLQDDPSLEPRDVIVMCPDIEAFAPLVQAGFGAGEGAGDDDDLVPDAVRPPDLRVRLADRALRQTNPVLGAVAALLELADARVTASEVLELADREPVRHRFRLDDDDLARLQGWIADAGIRWGLDAGHRAPFGLERVPAGTWRRGLDRLLLGVAMTEEGSRLFGDVLPLDDVGSGGIDLAGRAAELLDRLEAALAGLRDPQPVTAWAAALAAAADDLLATRERDAWQRAELDRLLGDVVAQAGAHDADLALPEVRALLADRLQGRPTRANFRTGHLTICTLMPMRSVPHRIVCLLGLDDDAFPRRAPRDGDDRLLDAPRVGDRDPRAEDRQLLLDALMAAGDRLIVTYTGNDERTNAERPPAVPVGELLDVVDRTATVEGGRARDRVVLRHPLQPFDPRAYAPGALLPGRPWGFDPVALAGAERLTRPRIAPAPFLDGPLPALDEPVLELAALVAFVEHPVRAFLRRRLEVDVRDFTDEVQDDLPVALDPLEHWAVGRRLLEARLAGVPEREACLAEIRRGLLPPEVLGKPIVVDDVAPKVRRLVAEVEARRAGRGDATSVHVDVALPGGRGLRGTVPGVHDGLLLGAQFSRLGPRHRLAAWVRLLALAAGGHDVEAITVGRAERGEGVAVARIAPQDREAARGALAALAALRDEGMREPLALPCRTAARWARAARGGADPVRAAEGAWTSTFRVPGEDAEPEHELAFGGVVALQRLLERGLDHHARALWDGLLACEELTQG